MKSARRTTAAAVVLATAGTLVSLTAAPAPAATSCASPVFTRQFYANTSLSGTPRKTDCDSAIDQSWSGAPASGLPKDNFGVRWSVTRDFGSGGPFALGATGLDGIRVYVDGVRRIDLWKNVSTTVKKTANVTIPSGRHTLRVDYANWTGAAKVEVTYAPRTSADVDKVKPLVPTGTSVSYDKATGKAKLTWAKNKEMDLAGYRVYRRLKGASFGTEPLGTTTSASYTDSALPVTGDTYYYEVRAYDKSGHESGGTTDQAVTTADRTAPAAPAGVRADVVVGSVRLGWDAVGTANTYRVYRAAAPEGPFQGITEALDDTSYRDTSADLHQRWYYRVTASDAVGNESVPSATADTGVPDTTPPNRVTGVTAEGTTAGNAVRWQAAADAEHYEVWAAPDGESDPDGPTTVFGTSYNDQWAAVATAVTYRVQAVDALGNVAPASEPVTAVRPAAGDSAAPTGVTGTPRDGSTEITWDFGVDGARYGYRLYRRAAVSEAWTRLGDSTTTALLFSDRQAPQGTADYYVVALDAQGHESAPSAVVTVERATPATPTAPAPPTIELSAPYTECTANDCAPHGSSAAPLTVTLTHDRLVSGYTYRFIDDGEGLRTTDGSTLTWTPPGPGFYTFEVRTVDRYGRAGPFTGISFMVG
ncbi:PA14 domain-containing protein [Streptomyces sp. NPDC058307]|uniref:PA14 domain-containing protein n=1 Tax=Streptomyces sp. NPDC058307 TaxID=3346439 RepID=UPI0036E8C636